VFEQLKKAAYLVDLLLRDKKNNLGRYATICHPRSTHSLLLSDLQALNQERKVLVLHAEVISPTSLIQQHQSYSGGEIRFKCTFGEYARKGDILIKMKTSTIRRKITASIVEQYREERLYGIEFLALFDYPRI